MQQFNFSPLDFSRIPQQETEARRNWYDSLSGIANTFGQGVQKFGETQSAIDQRNLAEEWKQKQWNNQRWQQDLANKRYEDEQRRLADERSRNSAAAEALRKQFLEKYNYGSLEKYGPGAQFALSQIENAPDYQGVVAGGNALTQAIQYQEMLRGQMGEREAQRAEAAEAEAGERFLADFNRRAALSGYTPETIGTKYSRIKGSDRNALRQARQAGFEELSGYADVLRQYLTDPSVVNRLPPQTLEQLNRRLMAYDEAVSRWSSWMQPRKTTRKTTRW